MDTHKRDQVLKALAIVRPFIQGDGGDVDLVDVSGAGDVTVRLTGNCTSCSSSSATLKGVIEHTLRRELAWLGAVRLENSREEQGSAPRVKVTASLEGAHHAAESHLNGLQRALLAFQAGSELPRAFASWHDHARGNLRRHFELEESVLFPACAAMLPSSVPAIATLKREHQAFFQMQGELERACESYEAGRSHESAGAVMVAADGILKLLTAHFLKEHGGLFLMVEQGMEDGPRLALHNGLQNALRSQLGTWEA